MEGKYVESVVTSLTIWYSCPPYGLQHLQNVFTAKFFLTVTRAVNTSERTILNILPIFRKNIGRWPSDTATDADTRYLYSRFRQVYGYFGTKTLRHRCRSVLMPKCLGAGQGRRQVKKCGVDTHGECEARAYNGGLGAEPPAGSWGRAPGQGGFAPLKLKTF